MATKKRKATRRRTATTGPKSRRKASNQVRTEMHHMRSGKHKIKSRKQAIAIGLNKAREKGAKIPKKRASKKK
jgi:uncharacterized protein DUF6496